MRRSRDEPGGSFAFANSSRTSLWVGEESTCGNLTTGTGRTSFDKLRKYDSDMILCNSARPYNSSSWFSLSSSGGEWGEGDLACDLSGILSWKGVSIRMSVGLRSTIDVS